jgi:hypothetical protein
MKLKIFLFWIVATVLAPIVLKIPVVGEYIVLITVLGPMVLAPLYFFFTLSDRDLTVLARHADYCLQQREEEEARAREREQAIARHRENLARQDWHFDTQRKYHSRDHWD